MEFDLKNRIQDVYQSIYAFENLLFAERDAARGKRGRPDVATFEYHLEEELLTLQAELREKTFRPGRLSPPCRA